MKIIKKDKGKNRRTDYRFQVADYRKKLLQKPNFLTAHFVMELTKKESGVKIFY